MIAGAREGVLDGLQRLGQQACCYAGDWPLNRCDCKYGGPKMREGSWLMSEQTGCPELRTLYMLVASMTDGEWADLIERSGSVTSEQLRAALNEHFGESE